MYFYGKEDKHKEGVGFLVHEDILNTVMGSRPVFSRLIIIRLKATSVSIQIVQAYILTSDHADNDVEEFYNQQQGVLDRSPEKDILVAQSDWNANVGENACKNRKGTCER